MLIIVAAGTPSLELDQLLTLYDSTRNRDQQEQIASQIYQIVGSRIQQMIQRAAGQRRLNADQLETLAWQALMAGSPSRECPGSKETMHRGKHSSNIAVNRISALASEYGVGLAPDFGRHLRVRI